MKNSLRMEYGPLPVVRCWVVMTCLFRLPAVAALVSLAQFAALSADAADNPPAPKTDPAAARDAAAMAGNEAVRKIMETYAGRGTLSDGSKPTAPAEALQAFKLRGDLGLDLVAAEPVIEQPLYASWDSQGRLWVTQYRQYQFPAGLKIVAYDQHLRARFDQVPLPPPRGVRGADKITVLEDRDGDGVLETHRDVIEGLNIASAAITGMGRIWVLNPPYLLSYADAQGDGLPDEQAPKVELSGFGLEDTHSVATSLQWGLDGWLYGANGSTTTGNVSSAHSKNVRWEGQCIWRYHPRREVFEIYAEGGGNTFSLDIDSKGRVLSGTNNGKTRGMHYEQGSYGIKGWGKHGPLTNPYAFGWFEHMAHEGDDKRFPQAFTVYEGGLLGSAYEGRIIAPNSLQNLVYVSARSMQGSTFRTRDEELALSTTDRWFRPVWTGVGPDGAVYMADWYDTRLSHVRPVDDWHKTSGRIYRLRPASGMPALKPFDLAHAKPADLLPYLAHPNEWFRKQAVLEIGWRQLKELIPTLRKMPMTLEVLWALDALEAADPLPLEDKDPYLRRWAVKIVGERGQGMAAELAAMAKSETNLEVCAQLLASAKRLPTKQALPMLWAATREDESGRLPLLAWWALESKVGQDREAILDFLQKEPQFRATALYEKHLAQRLSKRCAMAGGEALAWCEPLLALEAPGPVRTELLKGLAAAFEGGEVPALPKALEQALAQYLASVPGGDLAMRLRQGDAKALAEAIKLVGSSSAAVHSRVAAAKALAQSRSKPGLEAMLAVIKSGATAASCKRGVMLAAAEMGDKRLAEALLMGYEGQIAGDVALREDALRVLASRLEWAKLLVDFVGNWKVPAKHVTVEVVRLLASHHDAAIDAAVTKHWANLLAAQPNEVKEREQKRLTALIKGGGGDAQRGAQQYAARCAICHRLFGQGGQIGPELTGYDRANADFWLENLLYPSREIREGFGAYLARSKGGQVFSGLLDGQDAAGVVLKDMAGNRTTLRKDELQSLEALPVSLMPEGLLAGMSDADLRDLFAYLMRR